MASPVATAKMPTSAASPERLAAAGAAGFTLLELLVVLAIAGLLAALAPPAFTQMMDASRYRSTVRNVLATLHEVRAQSVAQGRPRQFVFDAEQRRFALDGARWQTIPEAVQLTVLAGEGVASEPGFLAIEFFPLGGATGGTVLVCRSSGAGVRITVDWLTGQISQQVSAGQVSEAGCG